jgi:hypothetical protein
MRATQIARHEISVVLPPEEIVFLPNAINETLNALDEWEFQTRTSETRKRAIEIDAELLGILGSLPAEKEPS